MNFVNMQKKAIKTQFYFKYEENHIYNGMSKDQKTPKATWKWKKNRYTKYNIIQNKL